MNLVLLKNIRVMNANASNGFTWGFPAPTNFCGLAHKLSRDIASKGLKINGVAVLSHAVQTHALRESNFHPYSFVLTRNPNGKDGKPQSITEEAKQHLTVSLLLELEGWNAGNEETDAELAQFIKSKLEFSNVAGGKVKDIERCEILPKPEIGSDTVKQLRKLAPFSVMTDRSEMLSGSENNLDSWLTLSAIRHQYNGDKWERLSRPEPGFLVPAMVGYRRISKIYEAGEVDNSRDKVTPFAFVEPVHGVVEWISSPSRIEDIDAIIWRYKNEGDFYVCTTSQEASDFEEFEF